MQLLTVEPTPQERYAHALNLLRSATTPVAGDSAPLGKPE